MRGSRKTNIAEGGVGEGGGLPKKGGGFGLFPNLKGGLGKKEGVVVLRRKGGLRPQCTL